MEMTAFRSQVCLIPGEQIMKYCLKFVKNLLVLHGKFNGSCMIYIPPFLLPCVQYIAVYAS